ncbi:hypothetical protein [Dahlia mosaic virus]|uniref:Uncharacterized protein n=1 Tax=Dahlia mosaic virus TaxID=213888 RepID=J9UES1_DMV|nr:hypothetical protein [Dahlia mosaic virus]AFR69286.1 hypothetical protein [Dahlia mosaic virus]
MDVMNPLKQLVGTPYLQAEIIRLFLVSEPCALLINLKR